jgi:hypothetical protein
MIRVYVVEVDQSGKFEHTNHDTVLAFSNGIRFAILIPAQVKRDCITTLRAQGLSGPTLFTRLFATGLYFLLRDYIEHMSTVVIDIEYQGREGQIKQHLLHLLHRGGYAAQNEQIGFGLVGKKSQAHVAALSVFRGNVQPDLILTLRDLLGEFKT